MANLVSFQSLTAAEYEALSGELVDNRIYFLTDSGKLMLNGVNYGKEPASTDYLCITDTVGGATISLNKKSNQGNASPLLLYADLEYSTDKENWTQYSWSETSGAVITLASPGDKVYFRGDNSLFSRITPAALYGNDCIYFNFTSNGQGSLKASGNVMSLLDRKMLLDTVPGTAFYRLFGGLSNLADISELKLPASKLKSQAYYCMFTDDSLVTGLPLMNTNARFEYDPNESSSAPYNWASLYGMMRGTGVTSVDLRNLPFIENVAGYAMQLFRNCASLSSVTVNWTIWPNVSSGSAPTTNWLQNASATGTFHCPAGLTIPTRDASGVPANWTIVNDVTA